ncbi:hypothetical protein PoB_006717800 [Plakobranchus ocellatus]|uniref:Uncharacterized protein n=1 Tax=Plakobranchus ocellatus TaxID=259542 RepID=A0AAV4D9E0_9GAST|nr:hypothetical protein PoB_006717800 [Plakobranchus ocellatus]
MPHPKYPSPAPTRSRERKKRKTQSPQTLNLPAPRPLPKHEVLFRKCPAKNLNLSGLKSKPRRNKPEVSPDCPRHPLPPISNSSLWRPNFGRQRPPKKKRKKIRQKKTVRSKTSPLGIHTAPAPALLLTPKWSRKKM